MRFCLSLMQLAARREKSLYPLWASVTASLEVNRV